MDERREQAVAARLAAELEATGHTVHIADGRDGPLRDAADALLLPAPAPDTLRNAAEWSIVCGAPDPAVHCAQARPLHCEIVADAAGWRVVEVDVDYGPRLGGKSKVSGSVRGSVIAALDFWKTIS